MTDRFVTSRLEAKARTVLPKAVREVLGIGPGDWIGYTIQDGRVILSSVKQPRAQPDPFMCFDEWASEVDMQGYASL
jgi:bifunctional DNA-binding transcriptional regulator/antitoxin component of YhaV-PrlF toxin-antitoxin module